VSKSKNNLTGLANLLSKGRSSLKNGLPSVAGPSTSSPDIKTTEKKLSSGSSSSLRSKSLNAKAETGIQFGKPSSSRTSTSASSDLSSLLKTTESSGLSGLLSGGGLLSGLTGLGGLGSLLSGLFGGGGSKTIPPLTMFALPQVSSETYSIGTRAGSSASGSSSTSASGSSGSTVGQQSSGIYSASSVAGNTRIVQAVRTAILSSSSLNDVINEI
jgi:hypothetical protein